MAHVLQGLTELDPEATVTSIDGVGAFDLISRRAMLEGLRGVDDAGLPFVRLFLRTTITIFLGQRFRRSPHRPSR